MQKRPMETTVRIIELWAIGLYVGVIFEHTEAILIGLM